MIGLRGASIDIHLMRDEAQLSFENHILDWKTTRRQLQRRSKLRLSCWSSHSLTQTSLRYFQTNCCLRVPSLEEYQIIIYQLLYRHGTPETHWENCFFNLYDPYDWLTTLIIRLDDANEHALSRSFSRLRNLQHLSFTGKGIIIHTQLEVSRCRAFLAYEVSASTRVLKSTSVLSSPLGRKTRRKFRGNKLQLIAQQFPTVFLWS